MRKTKQKKRGSVRRAKAVLDKLVAVGDGESVRAVRAVTFDCGSSAGLVVSLTGGRWTYCDGRGPNALDGVVGGYNRTAPELAHPLADLGLMSEADADAFVDWYKRERAEQDANSDLDRANE